MCSDITAEAAAALALASLTFRSSNRPLSTAYWNAAMKIYNMTGADTATDPANFTTSSTTYPFLKDYYTSTATSGHMFFGAAAMWKVCVAMNCTDTAKYLDHALRYAVMLLRKTGILRLHHLEPPDCWVS